MKRTCEVCVREIPIDALRCIFCNSPQMQGLSIRQKGSNRSPILRWVLILALGLIGGAIVIGIYWKYKVHPRLEGLGIIAGESRSLRKTLDIEDEASETFDKRASLPTEPLGFAYGRHEYVLGNRRDPWGLMRMEVNEERSSFEFSTVPVHEPNYMQQISFNAIAWNGKHYVAVADGAWFNSPSKNVFCTLDPETFKIVSTAPAPDQIGCLAFDGSDYWGATRSNTVSSGEPVFLYRLDSDFRELSRHQAPAKGCQGLAWNGQFLWFADVFDDSIYVLDITADEPAVVHRIPTEFSYLSGIAFDGRHLWVSEYQNHGIHRLHPAIPKQVAQQFGNPATPAVFVSSEGNDALSGQELKDSDISSNPEYPEEDVDVHELSAEISNGVIYASWKIHFGDKLFEENQPQDSPISLPVFHKYAITVSGPGLSQAAERTFEAHPGMNQESNVQITEAAESGEYTVLLFIHVQYVRADGGNQILNKTASPLTLRY